MPAFLPPLLLWAVKAALGAGALAALGAWLAKRLPVLHLHTPSAAFNSIGDLVGNVALDVVRAELQGDILKALVQALLDGKPLLPVLAGELPHLKALVQVQLGQAGGHLEAIVGGPVNLDQRLTTAVLAAAHTHALETAKAVVTLPDGHKLVRPVIDPAVSSTDPVRGFAFVELLVTMACSGLGGLLGYALGASAGWPLPLVAICAGAVAAAWGYAGAAVGVELSRRA